MAPARWCQVNNTNNGNYVDACRVIRVDGFWRTASDMYSRQFGLLETETVSGERRRPALPTQRDHGVHGFRQDLSQAVRRHRQTPTAPSAVRRHHGHQHPGDRDDRRRIELRTTATSTRVACTSTISRTRRAPDWRSARRQWAAGPMPAAATNVEECVLPYMPFTSANLTEIAKWIASDTAVLTVNSGNLLATNPGQPSGSRTIGKAVGTSDNTASIRKSNSGVAVNTETTFANLGGVDPSDDTAVGSDAQAFQVGGTTNTGDAFYVRIAGGGLT